MASPSAGMSKEEIKERLAQMKKQYAQMQKKLEKSDKATRVKRHVSKRIADYRLKHATGGSPECTTSRAAESPKDNPENTGSLSLRTVNRGWLSSEPKLSSSIEKRGKRRSVSFALSSQSTPTSSRHDLVQGMAVFVGQSGDAPMGVNQMHESSLLPQQQLQNIDRGLRRSGDAPNKKLFRNAKSKKQKRATTSSGGVIVGQSIEAAVGKDSSHFESGQNVSFVKNKDMDEKARSHLPDIRKHERDATHVPELLSSPDAKTPPEDTQFDLFADTDVQDESPEVIEVLSDSGDSSGNASLIKMDAVGVSLQAASSIGQDLETSGQTAKESLQGSLSECELKTHQQVVEESVVILDETQGDIFRTQSPKKCTKDKSSLQETTPVDTMPVMNVSLLRSTPNNYSETVKKSPSTTMAKLDNSSENSLHVQVIKEKGLSNSHQDVIHSVSDEEGTEDPDVIPSTFPEDLEPVTTQKSSASIHNLNLGHLDASREKCSQGRDPSPLVEKENNDFQSVSKQIAIDEAGGYEESEMKVCNQRTEAKQVDMAQTSARISTNGEPVQDKDAECILGNNENQQTTIPADDPNCAIRNSQDILIYSQDNTFQKVPTSKSPGEKGKTGAQRRRRKNQRSIDNLSVDDVSLKDFVLSQQSSQEGSHTWIDGLMYPAEYYVRKTRSMSRPLHNQDSAPLPGQKRPSKSLRGRKGPLSRSDYRATMSEPVIHSKLMDAEPLHQGVDRPETDTSEKIDLDRGDTVTSVEISQDSVGRRCNETGESELKDVSPPRKMKVLRKPAANKRRRSRKSSNKKQHSDSEQSVIETARVSQTSEIRSQIEIAHSSNVSCDAKNDKGRTEMQNIGCSIDGTSVLSNIGEYTTEETRLATSPHIQMTCLDPQRKPVKEDIESNADGLICESNKHISITQITNNPLESQFTQTQVPSNFALPHVFGSPEHHTQSLVGLLPGSPTSTAMTAICSPTIRRTTPQHDGGEIDPAPSLEQDRQSVQNQECSDHQWMSEVYMADVVPELPAGGDSEDPNLENLQEDDTGHLSPERHNRLLSQKLDNNGCLNVLPNSQYDPVAKSMVSNVSVMSATHLTDNMMQNTNNIPEAQDLAPENLSNLQPTPCYDINESEQHISEKTPATDLFNNQEPILDHIPSSAPAIPSSAPAIPSSLCSNVDQGSPLADAATGTPPEVAEMPQVQSQCTNSYRDGPEFGPGKEIAGGDLSRRECFQFKGCLEHTTDQSSEVRSIISSSLIIDDVPQSLVAVVFPKEIVFWVLRTSDKGHDFQVLCFWRTNELPEEIILVELIPGMTDAIEAVIAVEEQEGVYCVRCIRWDCRKARWENDTVLSSEDTPQTAYTSLCILQERKVAIAVYKKDAGSKVLVVWLHSDDSEKKDFPMVTLPASKDRINSLAAVQGTAHMMLGMTDSEALLWHVPSQRLVQVFSLKDQRVNCCIEATAESGLLFLVACSRLDDALKDHSEEPICSLLALNPRNGRSSKLLSYSAPCMKPGIQIQDVSVCKSNTLAVCLTSGHVCIWDLYSSQLLLESSGHELEKSSTALCLQDARILLLGSDNCVNFYERSF